MQIRALKTRIFREGEDLVAFILHYIPRVTEGSILVITSKIVALAQGRTHPGGGKRTKIKLMREESDFVLRTKWSWLTVRDHTVIGSAGIDESNANGKFILLPRDPFGTAERLRMELRRRYRVKKLGVMLTDSHLLPLRAGIVGTAIGYAGFKGVRDDRGKKDLFGRVMKMPRVDVADSIAAAAVLLMGETNESKPLALVTGTEAEFVSKVDRGELMMDFRDDAFGPIFKKAGRIRLKKLKSPW